MKKVCIFGAASSSISQSIRWEMQDLGKYLAVAGHVLIYGAGSKGVMGAVHDGYIRNNPKFRPFGSTMDCIQQTEKPNEDINLIQCRTIQQRKELYQLADICIICPGGIGTMDELFEFMTLKKLEEWVGKIYVYYSPSFPEQHDLIFKMLKQMEDMQVLYNVKNLVQTISNHTMRELLN